MQSRGREGEWFFGGANAPILSATAVAPTLSATYQITFSIYISLAPQVNSLAPQQMWENKWIAEKIFTRSAPRKS